MDPNTNLRATRKLVARWLEELDGGVEVSAEDRLIRLDRLLSLVHAMDEWLSRGGFLPEAWEPKGRTLGYAAITPRGALRADRGTLKMYPDIAAVERQLRYARGDAWHVAEVRLVPGSSAQEMHDRRVRPDGTDPLIDKET